MPDAAVFVAEMEEKNRASFDRLIGALGDALIRDGFTVADTLRLEQRWTVEAIETAALWLTDGELLPAKLALAHTLGHLAASYQRLSDRLDALGLPPTSLDVRAGGYSKLFAFFRTLQTPEERAAAGVTLGGASARRLDLLARFAVDKSDLDTTEFIRQTLVPQAEMRQDEGRRALLETATHEESQARARRASFRTIEILQELYDPSLLKRYLARSLRK